MSLILKIFVITILLIMVGFFIGGFMIVFYQPSLLSLFPVDLNLKNPGYFEIGSFMLILFAIIINIAFYVKKNKFTPLDPSEKELLFKGIFVPQPVRELTSQEQDILKEQYKYALSMYNQLYWLIPLFILIDILFVPLFLSLSFSLFILIFFSMLTALQIGMVQYGLSYQNIYPDFSLPVYKMAGILTADSGTAFKINGYTFGRPLRTSQSLILNYGKTAEITFSYFSRYIWNLRTIGD